MTAIVFDIETGPLAEEQLRAVYQEPTWEEFNESCDQRWKPETRKEKFDAAKKDGWEKFVSRAALSPLTGRVLAVGLRGETKTVIVGQDGETEPDILTAFWAVYGKYRSSNGSMIGYNAAGFDVPFLVRRSWFHGIAVPESLFERGRYLSPTIVDLMLLWQAGSRDSFTSLDTLARFFGIGGKPAGVDGADFARLWAGGPEDRQQALSYLTNDLDLTWRLAEKMGVL